MNKASIYTFSSLSELSAAAAKRMLSIANEAINHRGAFNIALAGGSTPRSLYELLARQKEVDWSKWQVYFSDERMVPLDDERSNYNMARQALLAHVPASSCYASPVGEAAVAAREYEQIIRHNFKQSRGLPQFDLILLGLGSDGHTASLFPEKPALLVKDKLVTHSAAGTLPPPVDRVTFTIPLINAAKHVIFLASGDEKAPAFQAVQGQLEAGFSHPVPAALVKPTHGSCEWYVGEEVTK